MADDIARLSKDLEQAHFRIDELVRRNEELQRLVTPEHVSGVAHGAVMDYIDKLPADRSHSIVAAIYELIATLSAPVVRTSTVNLPSGKVDMTVHETRPTAPRLRKTQ